MSFRMHHVAISVHDMEKSLDFYELFGFRLVLRYADPHGDFEIAHLKLYDTFLELWHYANSVPAPESTTQLNTDLPRIGVKHMALQVDSVQDARHLVQQWGIPIEVDVRAGNTGVTYFFVKDPSGNLLEILEDKRQL